MRKEIGTGINLTKNLTTKSSLKIPPPQGIYSFSDITFKENLFYDNESFSSLFRNTAKFLNPYNTASLLASTRIIGMSYPGLYSIYKSLDLDFNFDNTEEEIIYKVNDKFAKLNLLKIEINQASINGKLEAFIRPEISRQKSINELKDIMPYDFAKNQRAIVIGGSRGIGLQCLKLLALGGAKTFFTYYQNQNEAEKIKNEFKLNGFVTDYIQLNATNISDNQIEIIRNYAPSHIYYFATPKISANNKKLDIQILNNYINYYIGGIANLLEIMPKTVKIFSPSSIYAETPPNGLLEYSIAKSSFEHYVKNLNEKGYKIYAPRFPRIETVQTLSLYKQETFKAEDILKQELLNFSNIY